MTVGMFDALLSAPFEFVLTQSFAFVSKATGQDLLQRQYNQMSNAGDFAVSQAEELKTRSTRSRRTSSSWGITTSHADLDERRCQARRRFGRSPVEKAQRRCGARALDARRHGAHYCARGSGARGGLLGAIAGALSLKKGPARFQSLQVKRGFMGQRGRKITRYPAMLIGATCSSK
jgi:hypothetical protein